LLPIRAAAQSPKSLFLRALTLNWISWSCSNFCSKAFSRSSNVVMAAPVWGSLRRYIAVTPRSFHPVLAVAKSRAQGGNQDMSLEKLRDWVGRTQTTEDLAAPFPPRALIATFDEKDPDPKN